MPKVKANEIELFYDIQGKGEPLLLIAGFMCNHTYWSLLLPSLIEQYQVIRLDNRGIGQSSAPNSPYTIEQMASDAAVLLEHLEFNRVHVAGHSMGGQIAQQLLLAHPEKVHSLMLLSSWAKGDGLFNTVIETWGDMPKTLDLELYEKVVLPWIFTDAFYSIPGAIEQIINVAVNYPFPPTTHGLYHQSRAILNSDTRDFLRNIHCPTLILVGKQDILAPVKFSQQLAHEIPHSEFVVLECGGHGFLIESPDAVAQVMVNFLAKQSQSHLSVSQQH
ncbi:alpha/beta hydrolase [Nostocales cyanobacterium HT-58-2]|nr:alpha/beta hydrolase [Nostocales cyanobacterium HT-58-2]